jgi:hypothetical protein
MIHFIKTTFTPHKIKRLIISETIGRFIAFLIGLSSTKLFTYTVIEEKKLRNLFGILPRKQIVVHRAPHWVELLFAVLVGFIAMELFNYIFQQLNTKRLRIKSFRVYIILKRKYPLIAIKRRARKINRPLDSI